MLISRVLPWGISPAVPDSWNTQEVVQIQVRLALIGQSESGDNSPDGHWLAAIVVVVRECEVCN